MTVSTIDVALTDDQKNVLLLDDQDEIYLRPCLLRKTKHSFKSVDGYDYIIQEFQYDCLITKYSSWLRRRFATVEPFELEKVGNRALMLFYYSKTDDTCFLMAAVSLENGVIWIDTTYRFYGSIRLLRKPKLLRSLFNMRDLSRTTVEQRKLIGSLIAGAERRRADYAHFFAGEVVPSGVAGDPVATVDDGLL